MALRFAVALGLHVRNDDCSASDVKREVLIHVWWSLYNLERQLTIMTGRPSGIGEQFCSVPLPQSLPGQRRIKDTDVVKDFRMSSVASAGSPAAHSDPFFGSRSISNTGSGLGYSSLDVTKANIGSYFRAVVSLYGIIQGIIVSLYSAEAKIRSSDELHQEIVQLDRRLDDWHTKLPIHLDFQIPCYGLTAPRDSFFRERTSLILQFCSAKILLTRPYLSSFMGLVKHTEGKTIPVDFTQRMADTCVETAKAVVDLLPGEPQPRFLYECGSWWTAVHSLMQALAVLLLALHYSSGLSESNIVLSRYCWKIIRWLHSLDSTLADRAYRVAVHCFKVIAERLELPVSGELIIGNLFSTPYGKHNFETQAADDRILPLISTASYHYKGVTDSSAISSYGSSMFGTIYLPPSDEHTSDQYQDGI